MISIDANKCKTCGICGEVCPRHILETVKHAGEKITSVSNEREMLCMECGHCEAVCPNHAITLDLFSGSAFQPMQKLELDDEKVLALLKQRRSVRRYRDKPVPRQTINRILDGAHAAPTGTGRQTTGVVVLETPEMLSTLSGMLHDVYEDLDRALKNPIARFIIRRKQGLNTFRTLQEFVMPGMQWYMKWYREGRSDEILRDCPALILFHSPTSEPMFGENCLIAAFHSIMMAETLGIGTCFNDLIPPACNTSREIREFLGLSDEREVHASLTLGFPKYKFKRTIPRQLADVRYLS